MQRYTLTITATFSVRGREAEELCGSIGIVPIDNALDFDFRVRIEVPPDRVDDVVARDAVDRYLALDRESIAALVPGDYRTERRAMGEVRVLGDPHMTPAAALRIFDAVVTRAAARAAGRPQRPNRMAALFARYRESYDGPESALAYHVLADLAEHFCDRGVDVRALAAEACDDVETCGCKDGATA